MRTVGPCRHPRHATAAGPPGIRGAASRLSSPIVLEWWLPGIHSTPPEKAVVPPKTGAFSMIVTLRPSLAAVTAVAWAVWWR